ncbi:MAG: M28 family peptidase [Candidatus Latescibacteria bacterium]|nr:M28 family peptidase [Candidatus Latescibacterota bacterium]
MIKHKENIPKSIHIPAGTGFSGITLSLIGFFLMLWPSSCRTNDLPEFDGSTAFSYIEQQVAFGPRVPGSKAHIDTCEWITKQLKQHTPHVTLQHFRDAFAGEVADMTNIIASFYPEKTNRILLCAHWDCRPFADRDPNPDNHSVPVPGANDSASGVAVLLEIARILKENEPRYGVDIVFFDGEDGGSYSNTDTWILGSKYFAKTMPSSYQPRFAILLDMIGDKDLSLTRDYNSIDAAPKIWAKIEKYCKKINIPISTKTFGITDDHIPLIKRGIPAVDLIDFDYPSWHTVSDTPDKCSAESLGKIGRLVLNMIYGE